MTPRIAPGFCDAIRTEDFGCNVPVGGTGQKSVQRLEDHAQPGAPWFSWKPYRSQSTGGVKIVDRSEDERPLRSDGRRRHNVSEKMHRCSKSGAVHIQLQGQLGLGHESDLHAGVMDGQVLDRKIRDPEESRARYTPCLER